MNFNIIICFTFVLWIYKEHFNDENYTEIIMGILNEMRSFNMKGT